MSVAYEPAGKYIDAKDLRLHYHEFRSGDPVICLHGAGPGASGWSNFKGNLEEFVAHYRATLVDLQIGQAGD
jgi:pimeloyl-ACP methyl ester carboxylesterase